MKAKKILAMFIATALCIGSLAACTGGGGSSSESSAGDSSTGNSSTVSETSEDSGSSTAETSAITFPLEEQVTLTAWRSSPSNNPALGLVTYNDILAAQVWEEKTNVHWEWEIPPSGQEREQFNLMVTSGEYPDVIYDLGTYYVGGMDKAISDGVIIPLNDIIETYAPNYMTLIRDDETVYRDCITDEGNIPGIYYLNYPEQGPWYGYTVRKDWLDACNLDVPVTYDDWYEMLTAFKNEMGATAPLWLNYRGTDMFNIFSAGYGIAALGNSSSAPFYQVDGVVKYGPSEQGYEDYISMLAKWYSEGLIDPDFYTRTTDTSIPDEMAGTGISGAFGDVYTLIDTRPETSVDTSINTIPVTQPVLKEGDVAHNAIQGAGVRGNSVYTITTACENPELALAWADLGCTEEWSLIAYYGVEGETYTVEDGELVFTDLILDNPDFTPADAMAKYTWRTPGMYRWDRELQLCGPKGIDAINNVWQTDRDNLYSLPYTTLTTEEANEFARIMGDIDTYAAEQTVKFILGDEPLENFQQFRDTLVNMGINDAIALQQAALDRYYDR